MVSFAELKAEKEFVKLHGNREAILLCLEDVKAALDTLPTEKPSIRAFTKLEKEIEEEVVQLTAIDKKIATWYVGQGGLINDSSYAEYNWVKTKLLSDLTAKRDTYHELLKSKGLLPVVATEEPVSQAELVAALKTLAESTGKHAAAAEKQALAAIQHHKTPVLPLPTFDPARCKGDPLAWSSFWTKFELFGESCPDDKARLGFLYTAVLGDGYKLIKNLQCTADNFAVARQILEEQYNRTHAIRELLLLKCLHFRTKNSSDYSELVSAIIDLKVYISELKNNHNIDIMAESSGENLVRAVIHDTLPGEILDKYQSLTGKEYPTLNDFLSKAQVIAERLVRKQKNFPKGSNSKPANVSSPSTPFQQDAPGSSTVPASISSVNKRSFPRKKPLNCMFCSSKEHSSSRCSKFYTVKTRMAAIKDKFGQDPCGKCLMRHTHDKCEPCKITDCTNQNHTAR